MNVNQRLLNKVINTMAFIGLCLIAYLMFTSTVKNLFAAAPPVREQAFSAVDKSTRTAIGAAWTNIDFVRGLESPTEVSICNPTTNSASVGITKSTSSVHPDVPITNFEYELQPGEGLTISISSSLYLWGIAVTGSTQTINHNSGNQ